MTLGFQNLHQQHACLTTEGQQPILTQSCPRPKHKNKSTFSKSIGVSLYWKDSTDGNWDFSSSSFESSVKQKGHDYLISKASDNILGGNPFKQ